MKGGWNSLGQMLVDLGAGPAETQHDQGYLALVLADAGIIAIRPTTPATVVTDGPYFQLTAQFKDADHQHLRRVVRSLILGLARRS